MASRHLSRSIAMQSLYEWDFSGRGSDLNEVTEKNLAEFGPGLEEKGFVISGTSPDDFFVEIIELPKKIHPFFVATQAHPEYKSRPLDPHPMFIEFIRATFTS